MVRQDVGQMDWCTAKSHNFRCKAAESGLFQQEWLFSAYTNNKPPFEALNHGSFHIGWRAMDQTQEDNSPCFLHVEIEGCILHLQSMTYLYELISHCFGYFMVQMIKLGLTVYFHLYQT